MTETSNVGDLGPVERWGAAKPHATLASFSDALDSTFPYQLTLEFGDTREDRQDELAHRIAVGLNVETLGHCNESDP